MRGSQKWHCIPGYIREEARERWRPVEESAPGKKGRGGQALEEGGEKGNENRKWGRKGRREEGEEKEGLNSKPLD